jgi:ferritin-like metal-binding protein YciE
MLLSVARQNTQLSSKIYKEISQQAQDPDVKEALESRTWIVEKDLSAIDRCFELMGEKPVQLSGQIQEVIIDDFRKELSEIETPAAKAIFLLTRADRLNHARVAEYEGLVEAADLSEHYAVGLLLESCLAHMKVFAKRTRHFRFRLSWGAGSNAPSITHEEIAVHAYYHWERRGRPFGSLEVDWYWAIEDLKALQELRALRRISADN